MNEKENNKKEEKKVIEDEIFHIKKDGKEETIRKEILEERKEPSQGQLKKERNVFVGVVIAMVAFVLMFLAFYWIVNASNNFEYEGVKFKTVKVGDLILYDTFLPVKYNSSIYQYHFYLRTDPRTVKDMVFEGEIKWKEAMVINFTDEFGCEGQGAVATANFAKLQEIIGTTIMQDDNATCDTQGRYTFVKLLSGNDTKITEYGLNGGCYNIEIKDCEVLKGMEKFMIETLVEVNKKIK